MVLVHVAGAVQEPGVYELPDGARAHEAVAAAGGATAEAKTESVNLAARVQDGQQLYIPTVDEAAGIPTGGGGSGTGGAGEEPGPLNINTADEAALQELPGIGPALAGRIVEFRDQNGPFTSLDELDAVSGIGPVLLEDLAEVVTF